MPVSTYTTSNEIRAALGVSTTELPDSTLVLPMYDTVADLAVDEVHSKLEDLFEATVVLPTPTATEQKFIDVVKLYVTYALAKHLLSSLPLFSVQRLTDGKAEFQRQTDIFEDVRDGVDATLAGLRARLEDLMQLVDPTVAPAPAETAIFTVASTLAVDPVTG